MNHQVWNIGGTLHHLNCIRRLAARANNFLMINMAHQKNLVANARVANGLVVHLGHQRTCGVDGGQVSGLGLRAQHGTHAVRAEHQNGTLGHFVHILNKFHAAVAEAIHHMHVVHDLVVNINRLAGAQLQKLINNIDRHVDAGTKSAGVCKYKFHRL